MADGFRWLGAPQPFNLILKMPLLGPKVNFYGIVGTTAVPRSAQNSKVVRHVGIYARSVLSMAPNTKRASVPTAYAGGHDLGRTLKMSATQFSTHNTRSYHFRAVEMLEDLGHLLTLWGLHGAPGARLDHDLN